MPAADDAARQAGLRAFWDERARRAAVTREEASLHAGTVTDEHDVVALKDALELAHLERLWQLAPGQRVLDLGGGAGRLALRIAPRVAEITVVDLAPAQLALGRAEAARRGLSNVRFVEGAIHQVELPGTFHRVLITGVLMYLDDAELAQLVEHVAAWLAPGGLLVLKEAVSTTGLPIAAGGPQGGVFRPRAAYAEVFARRLTLRYQRASLAHPFPRFVRGTEGAVAATRSPLRRALVSRLSPVYVRLDPLLLSIEEHLRGLRLGRALLAPVPVLQDIYVLVKEEEAPVQLSVVMIAYNEAGCVAQVAEELRAHLVRSGIPFEIVLVDDGSRDGTCAAMEQLAAAHGVYRVVPLMPNRGIGGALRAGFDAAQGEFVSWVPADGQIPPEAVTTLYARRHEAPMLTTVYRTRADAWYRKLISASLNRMIALRTGQAAKSGGNYLFARAAWREHGPRDDDTMMLSTQFRHNLRAAGKPIAEVEIDCRARVQGHSKVLNPRAIARTFAQLLRTR